jgi:hypothetical protein
MDANRLAWDRDHSLIVGRVPASSRWTAAQLLRRRVGDPALREWLVRNEAGGLSPAQVRFWELVLDLPKAKADAWVRAARATVWERRHSR